MQSLTKVINLVRSPQPVQAIVRAMLKTPFRHVLKTGTKICHFKTALKRKKSADGLRLSEREAAHVQNIKDLGYTRLVEGELDFSLLERLDQYGNEKVTRATEIALQSTPTKKNFWVKLSDEDLKDKTLDTENPMVQIALQENVLRIVSSFFGEQPYLNYVLLTYSQYVDQPLAISQLWHLDRDDVKVLKLFVYLTDVEKSENGPFTLFNREDSKRIKTGWVMNHLPDQVVGEQLDLGKKTEMYGKKLSAFLVDTQACYHMGSRVAPGHSRLLLTVNFTTLPSIWPWGITNQIRLNPLTSLTPFQKGVVFGENEPEFK